MLIIIAFCVCAAAIFVLRPLCTRWDHVDKPGGHKLHDHPTPLCGGGAIVLSFMAVGAIFTWSWAYAGLVFGLATMAVLGALDDRNHVSAGARLLLQGAAVFIGMIFMGNIELHELGQIWGNDSIMLGTLTIPFTIFAAIGVINAINMVDGLDGLAGGFAFLVLALFAFMVPDGSNVLSILFVAMGCVAGFLAFNIRSPWRSRASIFLGDAGSLALGFLLTWFAIDLSQGPQASLRPITIVWIFGLPLLDTVYLMVTRALRGQNPMRADRNHFHHLLLRMGLTPGRAVYVWLFTASLIMGLGVLGQAANISEAWMTIGFIGLFVIYGICVSSAKRMPSREAQGESVTNPL